MKPETDMGAKVYIENMMRLDAAIKAERESLEAAEENIARLKNTAVDASAKGKIERTNKASNYVVELTELHVRPIENRITQLEIEKIQLMITHAQQTNNFKPLESVKAKLERDYEKQKTEGFATKADNTNKLIQAVTAGLPVKAEQQKQEDRAEAKAEAKTGRRVTFLGGK